ncbi:THAP domain-containing protein 9 [Trachymyrmex cornetzi]|uniref:THAP domain-containing protein 9 n=1 Tax=Trachymyrmex cornetzi TaxID=471704 RepID=A0A151J1V0_9HYME|nr:THAP domain-containing protein 9 [Trachymyrmex cornetzi]
MFNNAFDTLNVRSQFAKRTIYKVPVTDENYDELKAHADNIIQYISDLKTVQNLPILKSNRKVGFLGFIICLKNIFELWDVLKQLKLNYLLTFKLNQDHLETYFSAIRSRGGFNDNPNAQQFEAAYKRLMIRHEISASEKSNCLINDIHILHVSSTKNTVIQCGKLTISSEDVVKVTSACEKIIRQNNHLIFVKKDIKDFLALKIVNTVIDYAFTHDAMLEHIKNKKIFDNHRIQLIKCVIEVYVKIRLYREAKLSNDTEKK